MIEALLIEGDLAKENYPKIIDLLRVEKFENNDLSQSAEIFISENDAEDIENCTLVFPGK